MKRKIIGLIIIGLALVGCGSKKASNDPFLAEYQAASDKTKQLENFTWNYTSTVEGNYGEVFNLIQTEHMVKVDELDGKQDLQSEVTMKLSTNEVDQELKTQYWYTDGAIYIAETELTARLKMEMSYESMKESQSLGALDEALYNPSIKGEVTLKENGNQKVYTVELDDDYIVNIVETNVMPFDGIADQVKASMTITIEDGYIVERELDIQLEHTSDGSTMKVNTVQTYTKINETVIEFPSDLNEYEEMNLEGTFSGFSDTDPNANFKANLVEQMKYQVSGDNDEIYSADWGTESYVFNFDEFSFSLVTNVDTYTYYWYIDVAETLKTNCSYIFNIEDNDGCTEEEIANLKLSKEIYEQELNYSNELMQ